MADPTLVGWSRSPQKKIGDLLIVMPAKAGIQVRDFSGFRVAPAIASLPGMTDELCSELRGQDPSTTVLITVIHYVATGTSREFSDDCPRQTVAQRGDGVGHVTLRALGFREVRNPRVGKTFLIEWSFF